MNQSEDSGSRLQSAYRQMIAVILLLVVLAVLGFRYFEAVPGIVGQSLQVEHTRLLNVLAMTKSKWLGEGKPSQMTLAWIRQVDEQDTGDDAAPELEHTEPSLILMAEGGWPVPADFSVNGCSSLWYQLLGVRLDGDELWTEYNSSSKTCRFRASDGSEIQYQLDTGVVNFLTSG